MLSWRFQALTRTWERTLHTSPQSSSNVANLPSEVTYVFGRLRWYTRRPYWPSNQISRVFGLFGLQGWLASRHVCGHVACATCILRAPVDSPWVVDDLRHWNLGVMALLVEGYKCKIQGKSTLWVMYLGQVLLRLCYGLRYQELATRTTDKHDESYDLGRTQHINNFDKILRYPLLKMGVNIFNTETFLGELSCLNRWFWIIAQILFSILLRLFLVDISSSCPFVP